MKQLASAKLAALAMAIVSTSTCASAFAQSDPLYKYQWHLRNFGNAQTFFADTKGVFGIDLHTDSLHRYNLRGQGVVVAVVDDGLQIAHPDLAANVAAVAGKNFANGSNDPSPTLGLLDEDGAPFIDDHGTKVAGIIGAVGHNGIGVRGVAPQVTLKGFNMIAEDAKGSSSENNFYSWWEGPEVQDVSVFNNSWGSTYSTSVSRSESRTEAYEKGMSSSRNGLGGIYVKSAGNSFRSLKGHTCTSGPYNVGCSENNRDPKNNMFNVVLVTAVNARGERSSYSSTGSAAWVSGFGGEYGYQRAYRDGQSERYYDPAVLTTDAMGCFYGSNIDEKSRNALDRGSASTIDASCNYTSRMNGTSAAAPTVSGVAALMLEANPKLSFRDVKYILATTARQIHPQQPATMHEGKVLVPGWVTNAAGHPYSNWYGFGLVDAKAAVVAADRFKSLPTLRDSGWQRTADDTKAVAIGGADAPARISINLADAAAAAAAVESVQLGVATSGVDAKTLQVELVSPSGTRSVLKPAFTTYFGEYDPDFVSSNAFLDEPADGSWTLEVRNMELAAGAAPVGTIDSFKIRVLGH